MYRQGFVLSGAELAPAPRKRTHLPRRRLSTKLGKTGDGRDAPASLALRVGPERVDIGVPMVILAESRVKGSPGQRFDRTC